MMAELLGTEQRLHTGTDGPTLDMIGNSPYFLYNDPHPSVLGHNRLYEIYNRYINNIL